MQLDMFQDIADFHQRFGLFRPDYPRLLAPEVFDFRSRHLIEEINEFIDAYKAKDLPNAFDALIDLVYVALGTAYLMNVPWNEGWRLVHMANMLKARARKASDSKRGSEFDVVKPEGWLPADLTLVLFDRGWKGPQFDEQDWQVQKR